jgi:hypothetical protein
MKPIIMVMLAVQAAGLLAAAYAILFGRSAVGRRRPVWSSLAILLVIISATSFQIADKHVGQPGADILAWGAPFLLGFAIAALLMAIRQRRGLDAAE